ncbi:MAG: PqqD family protein [Clostridia bacterium]|nr:PqqD family protein [Clostridia bacterium]
MKIKQGFSLKEIEGQSVIVGDKTIKSSFNTVITLTDTTAFLWNMLASGNATKEEMLKGLLSTFDISVVLALNDIDVFIRTLKDNGILE